MGRGAREKLTHSMTCAKIEDQGMRGVNRGHDGWILFAWKEYYDTDCSSKSEPGCAPIRQQLANQVCTLHKGGKMDMFTRVQLV